MRTWMSIVLGVAVGLACAAAKEHVFATDHAVPRGGSVPLDTAGFRPTALGLMAPAEHAPSNASNKQLRALEERLALLEDAEDAARDAREERNAHPAPSYDQEVHAWNEALATHDAEPVDAEWAPKMAQSWRALKRSVRAARAPKGSSKGQPTGSGSQKVS